MELTSLGWSEQWASELQSYGSARLVRITARHKGFFGAISPEGREFHCYLPGRLQYQAAAGELPAVGDWCVLEAEFIDESGKPAAAITQVLPRRSKISRLASGHETEEQVLAANVDFCFIVTSANREFNIKRLHRYMLITRRGGVEPVLVLSKIDIAQDLPSIERDLQENFPDLNVIMSSVPSNRGLGEIKDRLKTGKTGVFIGSSGVGKSTLVNALLQRNEQRTREIRANDDHGRHTTSSAALLFMPEGGMIIDTPGLREIHVYGDSEDLERTFEKLQIFARNCKFRDCTHTAEPDCAVRAALGSGALPSEEYQNHLKLQKELGHSRRQVDQRAAAKEKKRWKQVTTDMRKKRKFEEKD
ncbi:MAG TPA: ribosome small subunit-dependent GTPase A [Gammaproteobacteria bacterium]|nr:ribosome small subunit-dependent GTPase A [Gammaproteobacteria bacterium]